MLNLATFIAGAVVSMAAGSAQLPTYQPEQLKADLALVRGALEEAHADLYRYTPKSELDRHWDNLAKSLNHPMNALEFYRAAAPVLALIKDGHLGWSISADVRGYLDGIAILPLGVRMIQRMC